MPESEGAAGVETQPVVVADEVLLASAGLAQRALLEATAPETVGSVIGHIVEGEHVLTLLFAADVPGYRGWHWSVTIARVEGEEPTVLETQLMPGDDALLAPEWVPWSDRLAEYRAAQAEAAEAAAGASVDGEADASGEADAYDTDDDDDLDDDEVLDEDDVLDDDLADDDDLANDDEDDEGDEDEDDLEDGYPEDHDPEDDEDDDDLADDEDDDDLEDDLEDDDEDDEAQASADD